MTQYATIFRRLLAYWIDILLVFAVLVAGIQLLLLVPLRQTFIGSEDWFRSGWNTEAYTFLTISFPVWLYFILLEISPWQATVGKRLLKLQTVDSATRSKISLKQAVVRTFFKLLPWELAHFTNNIPVPMWYDPNPTLRIGFIIVPLLVIFYLALAIFTPKRQSLDDIAAKTVVIFKNIL
jgi:uncharacterized RDD family membrane protein YckC